MGVKDQGLQEYLKDNERFADFVNGTLFAGKQIVDPCYLKEVQRKKRVSYKQSIMAKNIQKKKEKSKTKKKKNKFKTIVCVTGQHRKMLDQVLKLFNIRPDYDLNIMRQGQDLYDITARVLTGMRGVLQEAKPDIVLVHGDTTTSTASALAAFYQQIPVGHVEAGLRTHNIYSPWPEEMNRQITGRIATWHFSPTPLSRNNLIHEGIDKDKILITGNTVIDALYYVVATIRKDSPLLKQLATELLSVGYETTPLAEQNSRKQV